MDYKHKYLKYKNKYLKYKNKYLDIKGGNICPFRKFPKWIISMSKDYQDSVDYSLFKILPESIYSSELPFHIITWKELLEKEIPTLILKQDKILWGLNMTANIGAFDINMVKNYNNLHLDAIELDKCTYEALKSNIEIFNMKENIHPINDDSTDYIKCIKKDKHYDFVYLDPPWGGQEYKNKDNLVLKLSDKDIHEIIDMIFEKNISKLILLKAPSNFEYRYNDKYSTKSYSFLTPTKRVSYDVYAIKLKNKYIELFNIYPSK